MKVFGESSYFERQLAKSDRKIAWQYDRMLRFAGATVRPGSRVLDLGCGAAPGLRYFAARGALAIGADLSRAGLAAARRRLPRARLVLADVAGTLPFASGTFDLVVLSEVVEHITPDVPLFLECRRVLKPRGVVVLTTPNLWDVRRLVDRLGGPTWTGYRDPTHINLQTPLTLRRALTAAGFEAVRVRAGWKPLARAGGRRVPVRLEVPYPPLVGNGLLATGRA